MITISNIILVITATTSALVAGLFYAWSFSVTPGLAKLTDAGYIASFQAMNRAILNPVFFAAFFGTLLLLPISTAISFAQPVPARFWLLLAASAVYLIAVMGVTMAGNVPLNNALEAFSLAGATDAQISAQRTAFEVPWNRLNTIRTIASAIVVILVSLALLAPSGKTVV